MKSDIRLFDFYPPIKGPPRLPGPMDPEAVYIAGRQLYRVIKSLDLAGYGNFVCCDHLKDSGHAADCPLVEALTQWESATLAAGPAGQEDKTE